MPTGHIGPDLSRLRAGDVLLFAGTGKRGLATTAYQTAYGYTGASARVTHAAVFLADDRIVHARPAALNDGVVVESVFSAWTSGVAAFARYGAAVDAQRLLIAVRAASKCGLRYDAGAVRLAMYDFLVRKLGAETGQPRPDLLPAASPDAAETLASAMTCAQLVIEAYAEALGPRALRPTGQAPIVLPADLWTSPALEDVELPLVRY